MSCALTLTGVDCLQGFYRGMNGSRAPRLDFTMNGSSAFPVEFAFTTFLLPGSRPALLPCHPLAPSCSVADQEAVDNVTISGSRYITPGQRGIPPVDVPISWARLPQEAELRVGVRIMCLRNCRAADQTGQVAAIIFGTPPGHCPPGVYEGVRLCIAYDRMGHKFRSIWFKGPVMLEQHTAQWRQQQLCFGC